MKAGSPTAHLPRENWDTWDPMLISEGLFAAANIFSNLKLVYIFSVNPYLGPLQVSLSRMVMDILKFISLFVLVLFAFSCGKEQEHHPRCYQNHVEPQKNSCAKQQSFNKLSPFVSIYPASSFRKMGYEFFHYPVAISLSHRAFFCKLLF